MAREIILVGYSWGGGIALAYAAGQPAVRRVISVAGSDHGVFIRRFDADAETVRLLAYQDGHGFRSTRERLVEDIHGWIMGGR